MIVKPQVQCFLHTAEGLLWDMIRSHFVFKLQKNGCSQIYKLFQKSHAGQAANASHCDTSATGL